ncbi:hypothetical protein OCHUTO_0994 [Orientia chuto str. Dubai]|uniref:Uncharacterized protein n=1 Tax=Orientia chuto str. Dubai TaxID=1359168 RepID=A0A0F3MKF5_9RICK|nr:hypothetical protein OCHUTO_0994 [Orientia chuto str. Dubai]
MLKVIISFKLVGFYVIYRSVLNFQYRVDRVNLGIINGYCRVSTMLDRSYSYIKLWKILATTDISF